MLEAFAARPLDAFIGTPEHVEAVTAATPQLAAAMVGDQHALALAIQTIAHDTLHAPTEEHERLLAALRGDDDATLAASFRLLMAQAIVEAARDRASRDYQLARHLAFHRNRAA